MNDLQIKVYDTCSKHLFDYVSVVAPEVDDRIVLEDGDGNPGRTYVVNSRSNHVAIGKQRHLRIVVERI